MVLLSSLLRGLVPLLVLGQSPVPAKTYGHPGAVTAIAISPGGSTIAGGVGEARLAGTIHLWSVGGKDVQRTWSGHKFVTSGLAFSPDGRLLASVGFDDSLALWDTTTGKELCRLAAEK